MKRIKKRLAGTLAVLTGLTIITGCAMTEKTEYTYKEVKNPVYIIANDPWVVRHEDSYYYITADRGICVNKIDNIDDLSLTDTNTVWQPPKDTSYSEEIWAPELHYIDGEWYIYFAATDGPNENHRMYVLKGTSQDPTEPFEFVGQITDPSDHWAIDGTVLQYQGEMYFVWSGWEGNVDVGQQMYIAHMDSPTSIDSERVQIAAPTEDWERVELPIEEGPTALVDNEKGTCIIVYSASGSWTDDYCLGSLTLTGDDPMDADSWTKSDGPIFQKTDGAYGPGHCSFVEAYDGTLWMVYHCNRVSGSGWGGRNAWIQPVSWDGETLDLGEPIKGDTKMQLAEKPEE